VLAQVDRFDLTVVEAVARLPDLARRKPKDVTKLLGRLESQRALASAWLYHGRRYYYRPMCGAENGSPAIPKPERQRLSEEAKIRRFAMLSFCCLGRESRTVLTAAELEKYFPGHQGIRPSGHYVQLGPHLVLGFLRIDLGGRGRWDRVLAKCLEDARRYAQSPTCRGLVEAGNFEITLATALTQKAERLQRAFQELSTPPGVPIRITVIPDLLHLIAPPKE
jgi:hypothetical protein